MFLRIAVNSLFCWSACVMFAAAQTSDPPQESLPTSEEIAAYIQEVEGATDLDDAKKSSIKQLYQQATGSLDAIDKAADEVARFDAMIANVVANSASVAAELNDLPKQPAAVASSLGLPQLQQKLAEVEAEIARHRDELTKRNSDVTMRQGRQRDVPLELEAARKQLADITKQLATATAENEQPLLTRARRIHLRTQAALLTTRITALEKELPAYAATAELLPKQRDLVGQKLSLGEATRQALLERIDVLRRSEVKSQVDDARQGVEQAPDSLKPIARTTLEYVTQSQAILTELKTTAAARSAAEQILAGVKLEFQRTREKVESVGLTDALGIFLRTKRGELAQLRSQHYPTRGRRAAVQELQLKMLELEDARMDLAQIERVTADTLEALQLDSDDPQLRNIARKLVDAQRNALDSLLTNKRASFESLVALDSAERELVQQIDEYTSYIEGWILWVRSVPPLRISDLSNAAAAVQWLSSPSEWLELAATAREALRRRILSLGLFAMLFLGLAWRQRRFRTRLHELGMRSEPRRCREFRPTAEAAVLTVLISAVWPTLLFFVGWVLASDPGVSTTIQALGWAFVRAGLFLLLTESTRQVLRSKGLAASHFGWPEKARSLIARQLRWYSFTTPLVFLLVLLQRQPNALYHHSLGRLCFLALMASSAMLAYRVFRRDGALFQEMGAHEPIGLLYRLRSLVFLVAVGMPCLLFVLSALGYYYTAYQLAQRFMESVALALALLTLTGLLLRLILIHRRRLTFEQKMAARQRAIQSEAGETQNEFLTEAETAVDLVQVTRQTREFVRVMMIMAAFVFGWLIWKDVLPALEFLASIEVWRINLPTHIDIITLKHLFMSGLTFALTFVAVKNVPGLLELLFLQRLPMDAGARYAVTTIVRYTLAAIGVIIGFGFIHVQWSQYGWLVAAATVGLGFGLQEIFANFVSGLIVLLERPIRVGDVVTVDGVTGAVQRIHMRATVLRTWDHQELVVPNKEFVTTKLLNWTLTNAINRLVINVGIAYGSDAERARALMMQVVTKHPNVLADPAPSVTFEAFGDSTLNYVIRCYLPQLDGRLETLNDLHAEIHRYLNAAGIEIAFPQRDLHVRSMPPEWRTPPVAK